jgi:hypothetical protein
MATVVLESPVVTKPSRRTREHLFFLGMSVLIALVVFIGFARTYYLAGIFHAKPLPAPIVHIHGAVFTCWMALLVVQASLVGTGNVKAHRTLGLLGIGLALLVVALGVLVADEMLNRRIPGFRPALVFAVSLSDIIGFAVPVLFAFRLRRKPQFHKRLILIATIAMTPPAFGRWPISFMLHNPVPSMLGAFALLAALVVFDVSTTHRVHRATAMGSAWVVFIQLSGIAVGHTALWQTIAAHLRSLSS